jgi:GT2 family glycosyltransferase
MDEWTGFPGIGPPVLALEAGLVAGADLTVVSAERLRAKLAPRSPRLLLARNGVDPEHYQRHYGPADGLEDLPHPVIGYFGALASWVDVELLERIARRFPDATLALAGGVFGVDLAPLAALPNVRLLGQRPYEEMPRLLWHFDACIIPFEVSAVTHAVNPVKLYEYLWSGKPVVAPRLEELLPFEPICYLARDSPAFLDALERALAEPAGAPVREARRRVAEGNRWSDRYAAIDRALTDCYPLVSVVIVCHGGEAFARECLASLLEGETWPRLEVLVVDNASPDGTAAYLASIADPRLRLFLQRRNLGYPAANNVALREARGEIVVFLNNDVVVPPGLVGRLVRAASAPGVGLACATTNYCGNEARIEPGYVDSAEAPRFAAARARACAGASFDIRVAALYCAAARREVIEAVGPLDESFGIGMFEDDDYSERVRAAGWRVVCAEDAYVHHFGQGSFQRLSAAEYDRLFARNQRRFEAKWGRRWAPHRLRPGVSPPPIRIGTATAGPVGANGAHG